MTLPAFRLTSLSHGAGCACKLDPAVLDTVLARLGAPSAPELLVGTDHADDALVWARPDGRSLVATVDFFTPIVDDARVWGRIAATNAASDVYAMGGTPLFAMNIVGWPSGVDPAVLGEVIEGGNDAARDGGWVVAGGHSVDAPEPLFGQAVIGELDGPAITNAGALPGDVLVLTKPLGTGLAATAVKRSDPIDIATGGRWHRPVAEAIESMCRLNATAAGRSRSANAHAMTDVTGFGLVGHARRIARASGVVVVVDLDAVPSITGADELIRAGFVPGGTERNLAWLGDDLDRGDATAGDLALVADPQSSGGLLVSVSADVAGTLCSALADDGVDASVVGFIDAGSDGAAVRLTRRGT